MKDPHQLLWVLTTVSYAHCSSQETRRIRTVPRWEFRAMICTCYLTLSVAFNQCVPQTLPKAEPATTPQQNLADSSYGA